jgi:hypothetical protein
MRGALEVFDPRYLRNRSSVFGHQPDLQRAMYLQASIVLDQTACAPESWWMPGRS